MLILLITAILRFLATIMIRFIFIFSFLTTAWQKVEQVLDNEETTMNIWSMLDHSAPLK